MSIIQLGIAEIYAQAFKSAIKNQLVTIVATHCSMKNSLKIIKNVCATYCPIVYKCRYTLSSGECCHRDAIDEKTLYCRIHAKSRACNGILKKLMNGRDKLQAIFLRHDETYKDLYILKDYFFVFPKVSYIIIGKIRDYIPGTSNGTLEPLSPNDIEKCKELRLDYIPPLKFSLEDEDNNKDVDVKNEEKLEEEEEENDEELE